MPTLQSICRLTCLIDEHLQRFGGSRLREHKILAGLQLYRCGYGRLCTP